MIKMKQEQTMYVVNVPKKDTHFKHGIEYVLATVLVYQKVSQLNPEIMYSMDIEIIETVVTIDERNTEYTVCDQQDSDIKSHIFMNPYTSSPTVHVARGGSWNRKSSTLFRCSYL